MTTQELVDILQNYYDATVCFYNWRKGDDMYLKNITVADDGTEIYLNVY